MHDERKVTRDVVSLSTCPSHNCGEEFPNPGFKFHSPLEKKHQRKWGRLHVSYLDFPNRNDITNEKLLSYFIGKGLNDIILLR